MAFADGFDLTLSSKQRFIDQANYKHSWFLILTKDDHGLTKNAELIDVQPIRGNIERTARAKFRIDREANNVPFNFDKPKNQFITRGVNIKQITAEEIIKAFGINGVVYLGITGEVPDNTNKLAEHFKTRFGLDMTEDDILPHPIGAGVTCVTVTFAKMSVGFVGAFRVDLTTPIVDSPEV